MLPTGRERRKVLLCMALNICLVSSAYFELLPIVPLEVRKKWDVNDVGKETMIGFIYSATWLVELFAAPLLGAELRNVDSKTLIALSGMGIAGCLVLFSFLGRVHSWTSFIILACSIRASQGFFGICNKIVGFALLLAVLPGEAGFAVALSRICTVIGYSTGPPLDGFLYDSSGYPTTFLFTAAVIALCEILLVLNMPSVALRGCEDSEELDGKTPIMSVIQALRIPWVWVTMWFLFCLNFLLGAADTTLAVHYHLTFATKPVVAGSIILLAGLLYAALCVITGYVLDRKLATLFSTEAIGTVICGLGAMLLAPAPYILQAHCKGSLPLSAVAMALIGGGSALLDIGGALNLTCTLRNHSGSNGNSALHIAGALTFSSMMLGYSAGPVAGSSLVASVGYQRAMMCLGSVYFLTVLVLLIHWIVSCTRTGGHHSQPDKCQEQDMARGAFRFGTIANALTSNVVSSGLYCGELQTETSENL